MKNNLGPKELTVRSSHWGVLNSLGPKLFFISRIIAHCVECDNENVVHDRLRAARQLIRVQVVSELGESMSARVPLTRTSATVAIGHHC